MNPTQAELDLSDRMEEAWVRFAADGDPTTDALTPWPVYGAGGDPYLEIDTTAHAGDGVRSAQCDFWDQL